MNKLRLALACALIIVATLAWPAAGVANQAPTLAQTPPEDRTHMSLRAMLAAPLIAGNDLRQIPPGTLKILTNREVIAVNQDPLGRERYPVTRDRAGKRFTIRDHLPESGLRG